MDWDAIKFEMVEEYQKATFNLRDVTENQNFTDKEKILIIKEKLENLSKVISKIMAKTEVK